MSAEGMPQEKPSIVEWPLVLVTRLVVRFPWTTLLVAGALTLAAILYSESRLGFRTSRIDLLDPTSEFNRLWLEYRQEFGEDEDAVVVVQGAEKEQVILALDAVAAEVHLHPKLFHSVLHRVDRSKLQSKGLHFLSRQEVEQVYGMVEQAAPIVQGDWARLSLGGMCSSGAAAFDGQGLPPQVQQQLNGIVGGLAGALEGVYRSPWPALPLPLEAPEPVWQHFLSDDGRLGFLLLRLAKDTGQTEFIRDGATIRSLRALISRVQQRHPQAKIGLTGLPVIENDEMSSSQASMTEVSLVSLLGVSILFIAGFGGWRHPLLAVASLTIGTAWSFGYITLAVGHLNILSSAFAVILIGQGIDFSMYYVAKYLDLRSKINSSGAALLRTTAAVGPGVATGAITTALAFFMSGLTEFVGVAELGIVAGGGILLCWIAGMTVLPAAIHLTDTRWPTRSTPLPIDVRSWLEPLFARPRLLLSATALLTAGVATGLGHLWYDHNLLHLQAKGLESVELEEQLLRRSDLNTCFALSISDSREELLANKQRLLQLPCVKRVEEIASQFPPADERKQWLIAQIHQRLANLPMAPPQIPVSSLEELAQMLLAVRPLMTGPVAEEFQRRLNEISRAATQLSPSECLARISDYQGRVAEELLGRLHALYAVSQPEPPQLTDLPPSLVNRFVSRNGKQLMKIYSKADIWDMVGMEQFVSAVRSVDPRATGNPMQIYEGSRLMKRSYEEAALYALLMIVPVVFFDFRSLRYTLLAMLPLGLGMLQMFGLMGLLNIPLNPANMIVLPLILGIGIDAGVHVVHDFRSQRGRYRISASTASAVVINSVTNMAGFGSLMIASHRGLQSLGRVLTIGLSCCLFTALLMLPAMLICLTRDRKEQGDTEGEEVPPLSPVWRRVDAAHRLPGVPHGTSVPIGSSSNE